MPIPIAIIANSCPPYRIHLHTRIVRELPEVELWSIFTHNAGGDRWQNNIPSEINPVFFGQGQPTTTEANLRYAPREWLKAGRIIETLKEKHIQAVVMHGYNSIGRIRMIHWCRRHHIPCFLGGDSNIQGDTATGLKAIAKKLILSRIISWCSGILPFGSLGRRYYEKYGAKPDNIFLFPLEPDYGLIESITPDEIEQTRQRFDLKEGRRRLIYSGRLIALKRVDLILDAFASIAAERPNWDLVIAGDGPLYVELEARVPASLKKRVVWTGFIDDQQLLSALYRTCDVMVLASDYEAWSLVLLEGAAAGLALTSSSVVGVAPEIVQNSVNGTIFESEHLDSLIDALRYVTQSNQIGVMKTASADVLAAWRDKADPMDGLRRMLRHACILQNAPDAQL